MTSFILCCSCFRMDKKASEAFSIMFPDRILPKIVKGRDRLAKLASVTGNDHIKAISRLSGKFAYYVEVNEDQSIAVEYDLIKRKRIA